VSCTFSSPLVSLRKRRDACCLSLFHVLIVSLHERRRGVAFIAL